MRGKKIFASLAIVAMVGCQLVTPVTVQAAPSTARARSVYQLFDAEYYAEQNPDVVAVYGTSKRALYRHFTDYGMNEGRNLSADFDVSAYRSAYPDLVAAYGNDISKYYLHYVVFGQKEERTLVTVDACKDAGITVTDFEGNTIYTPYVAPVYVQSNTSSEPSNPNVYMIEDREFEYGVVYINVCGNNLTDGENPVASQGACPYELYTMTDNGDGTYTAYIATNHGYILDNQFYHFDVSATTAFTSELFSQGYTYSYAGGDSWSSCVGGYDEGCIHKIIISQVQYSDTEQ